MSDETALEEDETPPAGFNLDAEAGRQEDAAQSGVTLHAVVFEEYLADEELDADAGDGDVGDDDVVEDEMDDTPIEEI